MAVGSRRRPPSRQRYDATHPALTVHLPDRATLERVKELSRRSGLPMGEIVRRSLGVVAQGIDDSWERGRKRGYAEGRKRGSAEGYARGHTDSLLVAKCSLCGLDMPVRPGSRMAARAVELLFSERWRHGACAQELKAKGYVEWKGE